MRARAREERWLRHLHEDMQHGLVERSVDRVAVRFPVPIGQIEFNAAADGFVPIHANRRAVKIRTRFTVPRSELHDLDWFARDRAKASPEITREPARLQF